MNLTNSEIWKNLSNHKSEVIDKLNLREAFKTDTSRFEKFSLEFDNILFDFSKNLVTEETIKLLIKLAESAELKTKIEDFFTGAKINTTEGRAVLHTALRQKAKDPIYVDSQDIIPMVHKELEKVVNFSNKVHSGEIKGATNKKITSVVNIGIGGSDLGPSMVSEALEYYKIKDINSYFVSNVDPTDILTVLNKIDPETTLFIIASKTFTTQETMVNANVAKKWILKKLLGVCSDEYEIISKHFVALSTNVEACTKFGIKEENIFRFWDWVGGRYSLWSSIGLSIALSVGGDNFRELLAGAEAIDNHFRTAPFDKNIPVLMALLGVWYVNFFGASTYCIVPYDQYLKKLPAFLQQLDMESNGKSIQIDGQVVDYKTGPVIWGAIGTDSQHSFFQLIHQGTQIIPADFIAFANSLNNNEQHKILLSNYFAQTEGLMTGKDKNQVEAELLNTSLSDVEIKKLTPHKIFVGNKPTNSILIKKLTPRSLGELIAMYEHKVFVQGVIWNINSFDQWGVELGKVLAKNILTELQNPEKKLEHDSSTNGLITYWRNILD